MPRLTDEQVKAGILHEDRDVRQVALNYFAYALRPDPFVMPVVIDAFGRYGRREAFRYVQPITSLEQTAATIHWAVGELQALVRSQNPFEIGSDLFDQLLCLANPSLVAPFMPEILAIPHLDALTRISLQRRVDLRGWDGDALWRELESMCATEVSTPADADTDFDWHKANDIVGQLARQGAPHIDRMMALLDRDSTSSYQDPLSWLQPLAVKLAGDMRYAPAAAQVLRLLFKEHELFDEYVVPALVMIGGDDVVRALQSAYASASEHCQWCMVDILGRIRTDLAVQALIELLPQVENLDLQSLLGETLVGQFSTEGNEAARTLVLDDPDLETLAGKLLTACTLMGQDFPELESWRREAEERNRVTTTISRGVAAAPQKWEPAPLPVQAPFERLDKHVGRNDPCPCGSGKKFKKCCINKTPR